MSWWTSISEGFFLPPLYTGVPLVLDLILFSSYLLSIGVAFLSYSESSAQLWVTFKYVFPVLVSFSLKHHFPCFHLCFISPEWRAGTLNERDPHRTHYLPSPYAHIRSFCYYLYPSSLDISTIFYSSHIHVSPSCQVLVTFVTALKYLPVSLFSLFPLPLSHFRPVCHLLKLQNSFVMGLLASSFSLPQSFMDTLVRKWLCWWRQRQIREDLK